jgi:hypothetical protein
MSKEAPDILRWRRRVSALIVALAIGSVGGIAAGCGGDDDDEAPVEEAEQAVEEAGEEADQAVDEAAEEAEEAGEDAEQEVEGE